MSRLWIAAVIGLACSGSAAGQGARILLTPARLHRLQRERERASPRWLNFERRVQTSPESPERGFELALYAVVASDGVRGREAVDWAVAHPCARRQTALVLNWTREIATEQQRKQIVGSSCSPAITGPYTRLRDQFFRAVASGDDESFNPEPLKLSDVPSADELYALIEYVDSYRTRRGSDLRTSSGDYFRRLPELFLVASPPEVLANPSWQAHIDALALVSLDPNLESSQFLQSWGMESRFLAADGPGVGYEFLWADPYLPGLGYENLQPWLYLDADSTLWARSSWEAEACWVHIAPRGDDSRQCTDGWNRSAAKFGRLTLVPLNKPCFEVPRLRRDDQVMMRTAKPNMKIVEADGTARHAVLSDASGLKLLEPNTQEVCLEGSAGHLR